MIVRFSRVVAALAAVAGLSACSLGPLSEPTPVVPPPTASATPGTSAAQWHGPLQMPGAGQVLLTIDDIAVVGDGVGQDLWGVDLSSMSVIWTIDAGWTLPVMGDSTGLVVMTDKDVTVYDPKTGAVIGQAPLTPRPIGPTDATFAPVTGTPPFTAPTAARTSSPVWESLYWAGNGFLVMGRGSDNTVCARPMVNPGRCLWLGKNMWTPAADFIGLSSYVIADTWVNTEGGVRKISDGKPAPFGKDAGITPGGPVYYIGTSADRVFKMTSLGQVQGTGPGSATPWDVTTNKAISATVAADVVDADPASPVYVATINKADDSDTVTAYSWASGKQLWQKDNLFQWSSQIGLNGGVYLGITGLGFDRTLLMLDATTGEELLRAAYDGGPEADSAAGGGLILIITDALTAYDNATGQQQWTAALPEEAKACWFFTTPHYLAFLSPTLNLWALDLA